MIVKRTDTFFLCPGQRGKVAIYKVDVFIRHILQNLDKQRGVFGENSVGAEKGNQGFGDPTFGMPVDLSRFQPGNTFQFVEVSVIRINLALLAGKHLRGNNSIGPIEALFYVKLEGLLSRFLARKAQATQVENGDEQITNLFFRLFIKFF